jgi:hypothetical protein
MEGARAALRAIADSPEVHAKAARELAEEYFAIEKVLPAMLSDLESTS